VIKKSASVRSGKIPRDSKARILPQKGHQVRGGPCASREGLRCKRVDLVNMSTPNHPEKGSQEKGPVILRGGKGRKSSLGPPRLPLKKDGEKRAGRKK